MFFNTICLLMKPRAHAIRNRVQPLIEYIMITLYDCDANTARLPYKFTLVVYESTVNPLSYCDTVY